MAQPEVAVAPALKPGDKVKEKYEIAKTLGAGGFGAVFEVVDGKTKERLALKVNINFLIF